MAGAAVRRDPEMTDILRVASSREQRIVGLITVSDSGRVTATTAEGRKVVWKGRPDRLNDSTWRVLEYVAGMTRRLAVVSSLARQH
jgi:hypothetical protein